MSGSSGYLRRRGAAFRFRRLFPFLEWPPLSGRSLRDDAVAGITVALIAIPQSLAYAQLAGVPPYYGLYAACIPSVIGVLFGSSAILSTGPVAMTSLLTAASVGALVPQGTPQFYGYVTLLALLSGLFQLGFGLARAGLLVSLVSHPVLMGFVNAAALIIAMSQLPVLLGIPASSSGHLLADTALLIARIDTLHGYSVAFGAAAFAMLVAFRRFAPRAPGMLLTVGTLIGVSYVAGFAARGGSVVGAIPAGLPGVGVPTLAFDAVAALLPAAFVIALISFVEAASSCKIIAIKTRSRWNGNQELIGQGLAKIAAAFCQSMPVSGSFSRSALNLSSDARTGLSSFVTAACVLATLLFFTSLLFHLPKPVLAAVIMLAVFGLIDISALRRAWLASREDGVAATATFVATLGFAPNIQNGILTGIIISLATFLYGRMRPEVAFVPVPVRGSEPGGAAAGEPAADPHIGALRFDASLVFANASYFEEAILALERSKPQIRHIVVIANGINHLDASGVEVLRDLSAKLGQNGITLVLAGAKPQVEDVIERTGLVTALGRANLFATEAEAVENLRARAAAAAR